MEQIEPPAEVPASNKPAANSTPSIIRSSANSQSSLQPEASKAKPTTPNPLPNIAPLKPSLKPSMDPQATSYSLSKSNNNPSLQTTSVAVKKDAVAPIKNSKEIPVNSPPNKRQNSNPAQPFKPPQQLLQSPQVKPKVHNTDGVRSPGLLTPSPSMTTKKIVSKRKASGSEGLEAEDLFDMMSE